MLKRILNRFLGALPFSVVRHLSGEKLAAPFYHAVTDEPLPHIRHLFRARSLQAFEKDLDFFLKEFHPISLEDLLNHVRRGTPLPPNPLFLSVDDGLRENLRTVAPLCIRKGIPATFFVNPDFLDNRAMGYRYKASVLIDVASRLDGPTAADVASRIGDAIGVPGLRPSDIPTALLAVTYPQSAVYDRVAKILQVDFDDYLRARTPYLSHAELRELVQSGFAVGAHSLDHPRFAEIPFDEQLRQTRLSIQAIQNDYPSPCRSFAFPFGSDGVSEAFFDTVLGDGTADLLFCVGRIAKPGPRTIPRFWMEAVPGTDAREMFRNSYRQQVKSRLLSLARR
ncbi:MAG: polysaccharide deacetylase family protein [Tepidisphaeraceae bacterium]|jgi:peptidoglycan/xylan/chitin deacetylase (PgdA/CDA1 family)